MYIGRALTETLREVSKHFKVVLLTGLGGWVKQLYWSMLKKQGVAM